MEKLFREILVRTYGLRKVPGLHVGDCASIPNNSVPGRPKLSAIALTAKTILERVYLVLGLAPIGAFSPLSVCSHTRNFLAKWPLKFFVITIAK